VRDWIVDCAQRENDRPARPPVRELAIRDEEVCRRRFCHARLPYVLDDADHFSVGSAADPAGP
jgi:hypothetical protein